MLNNHINYEYIHKRNKDLHQYDAICIPCMYFIYANETNILKFV